MRSEEDELRDKERRRRREAEAVCLSKTCRKLGGSGGLGNLGLA